MSVFLRRFFVLASIWAGLSSGGWAFERIGEPEFTLGKTTYREVIHAMKSPIRVQKVTFAHDGEVFLIKAIFYEDKEKFVASSGKNGFCKKVQVLSFLEEVLVSNSYRSCGRDSFYSIDSQKIDHLSIGMSHEDVFQSLGMPASAVIWPVLDVPWFGRKDAYVYVDSPEQSENFHLIELYYDHDDHLVLVRRIQNKGSTVIEQ